MKLKTSQRDSKSESKFKTCKKVIRVDTEFSNNLKRSKIMASSFKSTKLKK